MKTISAALTALFTTREFNFASLFQYTLIDGSIQYYCSGDTDIYYNGHTWSAGGSVGPYFDKKGSKAKAHWKIGVEVDTLVFDVIPGSSSIGGTPFLQAVQQGIFDGAELIMHRAYWGPQAYQTPIIPVGAIENVFVGRIAELDATRSLATTNVNSHLELLNQNMPVELYQAGCLNTLYGTACTLNQASFAVNGSILSGGSSSILLATLSAATDYFSLGKIKFTSGVNNGVWRGVKQYTNGSPSSITLTSPFPETPTAGDTFTIYPGCDKQQSTCLTKFNNLVNFRGFPYIPEVSTAV